MKTWKILFGAIAMTAIATTTYAQRCVCCGESGPVNYNATAETTLTGTIDDISTMGAGGGAMAGVHLMVNTPSGLTEVRVGPTWYVSSKNMAFAKGDALTIVGSHATVAGKSVVIAREITKGSQTLTLRDAKGFPLWSRPMRGR
jgi:hypothetical protein